MAAEADERGNDTAVRVARLQRDYIAVEEAALAPAVDDLPRRPESRRLTERSTDADAPRDPRGLELSGGEDRDGDDLPLKERCVVVEPRVPIGRQRAAAPEEVTGGRRRAVGVIPVQEHALGDGSARLGHPLPDAIDRG